MNRRLDSWKAIAEYLGRDAATARRWEKTLGLPVHRVGGAGRSVFAYTEEIDRWMASNPAERSAPAPASPSSGVPAPPDAARPPLARRTALAATVVAAVLGTVWWAALGRAASAPLRVMLSERRVVALDDAGRERWRYDFPADTRTAFTAFGTSAFVLGGVHPAVFVATSHRWHPASGATDGGELMEFDTAGRWRRSFKFDDEVTVRATAYSRPWMVTDFAVDGSGGSQTIAVAAHHHTWSPGIVTLLDRDWRRGATFVNDGWIETLEWVGPRRLVVGGFDQEHDAGVAVLLDSATMQPLRKVAMPRSEINVATASRFNRALIEVMNDRVIVRTLEVPKELSQGAIDGVFEFTPSLELVRASYSGRYWETHRSLELQGTLHHTQAECPDRNGPHDLLVWEPATGWHRQLTIP